jgi:hypothetical protein
MRLPRRPGVWLATLSTVVAVATGMFTLRDRIFPRQAGITQASVLAYEQSVGETCRALNQAARARAKNAKQLAERLSFAHTTVAQRNALLDSTRQLVARSEQALIRFRGLDVPAAMASRARETAAAWMRMIARVRRYEGRLDAARNRHELISTVKTLSAMRMALGLDGFNRSTGLTSLGGGQCNLGREVVPPALALPEVGTLRRTFLREAQLVPDVSPPYASLKPQASERCAASVDGDSAGGEGATTTRASPSIVSGLRSLCDRPSHSELLGRPAP